MKRAELIQELNRAFVLLSTIPLAGDDLDKMAAAKVILRKVVGEMKEMDGAGEGHSSAPAEKTRDGRPHGAAPTEKNVWNRAEKDEEAGREGEKGLDATYWFPREGDPPSSRAWMGPAVQEGKKP